MDIVSKQVIEWIKRYGVFVLVGLVGLSLIGVGVWMGVKPSESKVEIVRGGEMEVQNREIQKIKVDVAGAVEKPGVYEVESVARVGEVLVKAGGLSAKADRVWVTRYINLAKKVKDGEKIYIPYKGEQSEKMGEVELKKGEVAGVMSSQTGKVNINTANVSELDSLWGIGKSRAESIVSNRPYGSVEELKSKASIPSNVYEKIKDEVVVY